MQTMMTKSRPLWIFLGLFFVSLSFVDGACAPTPATEIHQEQVSESSSEPTLADTSEPVNVVESRADSTPEDIVTPDTKNVAEPVSEPIVEPVTVEPVVESVVSEPVTEPAVPDSNPEPNAEMVVVPEKVAEQPPERGPICQEGQSRACFSGALKQIGVGECKAGVETCQGGVWSACVGEVVPQPEVCDNKDRDCDGYVAAVGKPCVTTLTGWPHFAYRDGPALQAQLSFPQGLIVDANGLMYIVDSGNARIRTLTPGGQVTTLAGAGEALPFRDGPGHLATFNRPMGVALDLQGHLIVAEFGAQRIRRVSPTGVVSTLAGTGQIGRQDGPGNTATFASPSAVAVDAAGNIFVCDKGNHVIRKIDTSGNVSTYAGTGAPGHKDGPIGLFNSPSDLVISASGVLYVADTGNHMIRKIDTSGNVSTVAGTGAPGHKDGAAMQAQFSSPVALALDAKGQLYIADKQNFRIRKIDTSGIVSTFAGDPKGGFKDGPAAQAQFHFLGKLSCDASGNLYVSDNWNHRIRKVDPMGNVSTIAGNGAFGYLDGPRNRALFQQIRGITLDKSGGLWVADTYNNRIRKVDASGNVTTIAGAGQMGLANFKEYKDGPGAQALLNWPIGLAFDSLGRLVFADSLNRRIRRIDAMGVVSTIAGSGKSGTSNGTALQAEFMQPVGLAFDSAGQLLISDAHACLIRKLDTTNNVSTVAGSTCGSLNGPSSTAQFYSPASVAFNQAGELLIASVGSHTVRKIDKAGNVTTVAGTGQSGFADGPALQAQFSYPRGLVFDAAGNLYIADTYNHRIRKLDTSGNVTTVAGTGTAGYRDGTGSAALLSHPEALAIDANGVIYVTDGEFAGVIRKITP